MRQKSCCLGAAELPMTTIYAISAVGVVVAVLAWKTQAMWAMFAAAAINAAAALLVVRTYFAG